MNLRTIVLGALFAALFPLVAAAQTMTFDPSVRHTYFNDFDTYVAGNWTITTTEAGAGSATEALTNVDGGALLVTNDDADDDADFFQKVGESFKFETGKSLYCSARFKVSDATQSDLVFGLQITDTTPLAVTDGIYWRKDDGDANLDFVVIKDSTATTATAASTLSDDTYVELGFSYDGSQANIKYLVDGAVVGASALTNAPDDEELTVSWGIQIGAAAAKTMTVDWLLCSKGR